MQMLQNLLREGTAWAGVVLHSYLVHSRGAGPLSLLFDTVIQESNPPNAIPLFLFWAGPALLLNFQIWETVAKQSQDKIKEKVAKILTFTNIFKCLNL